MIGRQLHDNYETEHNIISGEWGSSFHLKGLKFIELL